MSIVSIQYRFKPKFNKSLFLLDIFLTFGSGIFSKIASVILSGS